MPTWRAAALLAIVASASPACGRFTTADPPRDGVAKGPTTTVRYGSVLDVTTSTRPRDATTSTSGADTLASLPADRGDGGVVDVRVVDVNGTPRAGIQVAFDGPGPGTVTSDRSGHVRFSAKPGRYRASVVEGCGAELEVVRGGHAELAVAAGQTTTGDLRAELRLRFGPASPVSYSGDASWHVGERHQVAFRLVDRCGDAPAPAPAAYASARFVAGPGVEVVAPLPDGIGGDGQTVVVLRCTSADEDVSLDVVDAVDDDSRQPVLVAELLSEQRPPFCVR